MQNQRDATRSPSWSARLDWLRLLLPIVCLLVGCHAQQAEKNPQSKSPSTAELPELSTPVMTVAAQTWPTIVRTQGSLMADEVTTVGAKAAGRVLEVHVDLGDQVEGNALLVSLDQQEYELLVRQAEAQLAQSRAAVGLKPGDDASSLDPVNAPPVRESRAVWTEAQKTVERFKLLREQNAASSAQFDQAMADERVAEARYASSLNSVREKLATITLRATELSLAQQRLADSVTHAPFAGSVQRRHVAPGTYVQIGQPLISLVRTSTLRFRGALPERHARSLKMGQSVVLKIEGVEEPQTACVTRISPALDEVSRSLTFEADVPNHDARFRSGIFAEAEVVVDAHATAITIPRSALIRFAGVEKVWKITDGVAGEAVVESGRQGSDQVEIVRGLQPGDVILQDGRAGRIARITSTDGGPHDQQTADASKRKAS